MFQETVVPYKVGLQAHSRLEVDQLASLVRKTQRFHHSLCKIQSPSLIQLRVQCHMMTYAYMKTECLEHLHILCLYNKVMKNNVTCILMEISMASNGATLSDRAHTI